MALDTILLPCDGAPPSGALQASHSSASGSRGKAIALSPLPVPASLPLREVLPTFDDGDAPLRAALPAWGEGVAVEIWPTREPTGGFPAGCDAQAPRSGHLPPATRLALAAPAVVVRLRWHRSDGAAGCALSGTPAGRGGRLVDVRRMRLWPRPRTDRAATAGDPARAHRLGVL